MPRLWSESYLVAHAVNIVTFLIFFVRMHYLSNDSLSCSEAITYLKGSLCHQLCRMLSRISLDSGSSDSMLFLIASSSSVYSISSGSYIKYNHMSKIHTGNVKVRKRAKIRNRYNQAPLLTQDTNG